VVYKSLGRYVGCGVDELPWMVGAARGGWGSAHACSYVCFSQLLVAIVFDIAVTAVLPDPALQLANLCQCSCLDYSSS